MEMNFNENYLPKSDVVFTIMFLNKRLCEQTLQAILGKEIELVDIVAEAKNNLYMAALNSIYFDIKTKAVDGRIITLDLQRKYSKNRIRNRTVYYACREVSIQKVIRGEYEDLKNVVVSFILTEAPLIHTTDNSKIQLQNCITGEVYSDLLSIYEVNIQHINPSNSLNLQILRDFFEICNQCDFNQFVSNYADYEYGRMLFEGYLKAVSDPTLLNKLERSDKIMNKLSDEERMEIKEKAIEEGLKEGTYKRSIEIARNMLKKGFAIKDIVDITSLDETEIKKIAEQ